MTYKIRLPIHKMANIACEPFRMIENRGKPSLTFNEALGILTETFMLQNHLFPLGFDPTNEYKYTKDEHYLYIEVPKSSVETRELLKGEIGYKEKGK